MLRLFPQEYLKERRDANSVILHMLPLETNLKYSLDSMIGLHSNISLDKVLNLIISKSFQILSEEKPNMLSRRYCNQYLELQTGTHFLCKIGGDASLGTSQISKWIFRK